MANQSTKGSLLTRPVFLPERLIEISRCVSTRKSNDMELVIDDETKLSRILGEKLLDFVVDFLFPDDKRNTHTSARRVQHKVIKRHTHPFVIAVFEIVFFSFLSTFLDLSCWCLNKST